jgi:hypothetical protein
MNQSNLHNAMAQNAGIQQNSANQAAILNAQEVQQHQANQLNAYGQMGNIGNQMRVGDVQQGSYVTGSQQAGLNANDATALGYGNQALGAGNLGLAGLNGNANTQLGYSNLQNTVNTNQLTAQQNYEKHLEDYYGMAMGAKKPGTDYTPLIAGGAALISGLATMNPAVAAGTYGAVSSTGVGQSG